MSPLTRRKSGMRYQLRASNRSIDPDPQVRACACAHSLLVRRSSSRYASCDLLFMYPFRNPVPSSRNRVPSVIGQVPVLSWALSPARAGFWSFLAIAGFLVGCATGQYDVTEIPNADHLVGKHFSSSIFKGRQVYTRISETETLEELENRRSDGCALIFGVQKSDDVILYWRVEPSPERCRVRRKPLNR